MRSLATGIYTDAQVRAQYASPSASFTQRFEVLAPDLSLIGPLSTVAGATVEMNVDRTIKGALELTMLADASLVRRLFQRRIRPWFQLTMPDGGVAEIPMGVYVWNVPKRALIRSGVEEWTMTLGDQGHILDAGGPGTTGFTIAAGERITDAIARACTMLGFIDLSGIVGSPKTAGAQTTWGLSDDKGIVTWTRVLTDLHGTLAYYSPWFDGLGRYRATPIVDLVAKPADWTYQPGQYEMLQSGETDEVLDAIANRVFVTAANQGAVFGAAVSEADTVIPGHPLGKGAIGFYIDKLIEDQVAGTIVDIQLRAYSELTQSLSRYQKLDIKTLFNPAHEAFDVIAVAWPNDSELANGLRWHERGWAADLFDPGAMRHTLNRLDI